MRGAFNRRKLQSVRRRISESGRNASVEPATAFGREATDSMNPTRDPTRGAQMNLILSQDRAVIVFFSTTEFQPA